MRWREIQKTNFRHIKPLAEFLEIDPHQLSLHPGFPLNLPKRLAQKMAKNRLDDPLVRQFVPLAEEAVSQSQVGFSLDPVQDASFCKSPRLLQKYEGRALLITTSACAMHCRYCFRQNFEYGEKSSFVEELDLIRSDPTLDEIILSGGDPLSLGDEALKALLGEIALIPHIKLIRFHTRFPIGIPERIDSSFLKILAECPKQIVFVIHANHPKELDDDVIAALKSVQRLSIPVLLQSILLRGINDDVETLKGLFLRCITNGIIPYYLHQLDRVAGAAHFEVSEEKGRALLAELQGFLPGYAIPRYVKEIPGKRSKTPLV